MNRKRQKPITHLDKGLESKRKLFEAAKEEFYEFGYKNAKIQHIVDRVDVPLGLFSYYFRTKETVVKEICTEYIETIYIHLFQNDWFADDTTLFRHIFETKIYYENILSDQNFIRFYYEILARQSNYRSLHSGIQHLYGTVCREYGLNIADDELEMALMIDFGARRELILSYYNDLCPCDIHCAVDQLNFLVAKLINVPSEEISRIMEKSQHYFEINDFSQYRLL